VIPAGIVALILGYVFGLPILVTFGVALVVVGVVLMFVGGARGEKWF
jgi:hypothetical protein